MGASASTSLTELYKTACGLFEAKITSREYSRAKSTCNLSQKAILDTLEMKTDWIV